MNSSILRFIFVLGFVSGAIGCTRGVENENWALDLNDVITAFEMRNWYLDVPSDVGEDDLIVLVSVHADGRRFTWAEVPAHVSGEPLKLILFSSPRDEGYSYVLTAAGRQTRGQVTYPFSHRVLRFAEKGDTVRFGEFLVKGSLSEEGEYIRVSRGMTELEEGEHGIRAEILRGYFE